MFDREYLSLELFKRIVDVIRGGLGTVRRRWHDPAW